MRKHIIYYIFRNSIIIKNIASKRIVCLYCILYNVDEVMRMDPTSIGSIIEELLQSNEIKIADIPDIDLYMDQVTTFIDNKLGNEKRDKKDKLLTKTMINNYSKAKVLTPSKNKKYNKQQMIQLILIYYLKQVLSINDIHDLLTPVYQLENSHKNIMDDIYSSYLKIKKKSMDHVKDILIEQESLAAEAEDSLKPEEQELAQDLLAVLMLASQAQACKRAAEAIIDKRFKKDS